MKTPDELISEVGADYTQLRALLADEKWEEADRETKSVMLWAARREKQGWLDSQDIQQFPCNDLLTIDQLWIKSSNGHFGFSVQKRIWESCNKNWDEFGDRVGWSVNGNLLSFNSITYKLIAPVGHLPWKCCFWDLRESLFFRVDTCKL